MTRQEVVAPTAAITRLRGRMVDATRLIEIHEECTGNQPGRRHGYDALNRSAVVLAVAAWEGFVEDAIEGSVAWIARRAVGPEVLPKRVRDSMLAHLHETQGWSRLSEQTRESLWRLTGRGWRQEYIRYARDKIGRMNTPKHSNVKKAFSSVIGLDNYSIHWNTKRLSEEDYVEKLDNILNLRHRIAHGSIGQETVGKTKAKKAIDVIGKLAAWTSQANAEYLLDITEGRALNSNSTRSE